MNISSSSLLSLNGGNNNPEKILILFCNLYRETSETIANIHEKEIEVSTTDIGNDLPTVVILQRKHEALQRNIAALSDKVILVLLFISELTLVIPCDTKS